MRRIPLVLVLVLLVVVPGARAWTWPADGPVLRGFVFDPAHPYAGGQHRGIAVGAAPGTPVLAAAGGTVTFAGSVPGSGAVVTIRTADGYSVTLVHLGTVAVARGAAVAEGEVVGSVGGDGYVHLGVRVASDPNGYVDPLAFLPPRFAVPAPGAEADGAAVVPPPAAAPAPSSEPAADAPPPADAPAAPAPTEADAGPPVAEPAAAPPADAPVATEAASPVDAAPVSDPAPDAAAAAEPPTDAPAAAEPASPVDAAAGSQPAPDAAAAAEPPTDAPAVVEGASPVDAAAGSQPAPDAAAPAAPAPAATEPAQAAPPARPEPAPAVDAPPVPIPVAVTAVPVDDAEDPTAGEEMPVPPEPGAETPAPPEPGAPAEEPGAVTAEPAPPPDVTAVEEVFGRSVVELVSSGSVAAPAHAVSGPAQVAAPAGVAAPTSAPRARARPAAAPARAARAAADPPRVALQRAGRRRPVHELPSAPSVAPRAATVARHRSHRVLFGGLLAAGLAAAAGLAKAARMISTSRPRRPEGAAAVLQSAEDPGRRRLAVCERTEAHRTRGGVRRPVRHLRALPPAEGERRPDGERDGRARDAGDGRGGPGRRLAA